MQKTTMIVALAVVATMAMPTDAAAPTSATDLYEKNYELLIAPVEEMVEGTPINLDAVTATVRTEAGYQTMSVRDAVRGQSAFYADRDIDVEVLNLNTAAEQGSWPIVSGPLGYAVDFATSQANARESYVYANDHSADTTATCAGNVDEKRVEANPLSGTLGGSSLGGFSQSVTRGIITTTGIDISAGNNGYAGSYNPETQEIDDNIYYGGGVYSAGSEPTTVLGGVTYDFYCFQYSFHQPTYCVYDWWSGYICYPGLAIDLTTIGSTTRLGGYINDDENLSAQI